MNVLFFFPLPSLGMTTETVRGFADVFSFSRGGFSLTWALSPPRLGPLARAPAAAHRVGVERRERDPRRRGRTGPGRVVRGRGRRRRSQQSRVRLQRQLQVQDVVDDMLQDLHFADFLVGRDGGHQPPQAAVAVVHIALQAQRRLVRRRRRRLAARCRRRCRRCRTTQAVPVLGQAAQSRLPAAAARRRFAARGAHRAHRLHRARRPARADPLDEATLLRRAREAGSSGPPPAAGSASLASAPGALGSRSGHLEARGDGVPTIGGRVAPALRRVPAQRATLDLGLD